MSSDILRKKAEKLLKENKTHARTGCLLLDLLIVGGEGLGIPWGTGLNLVGISGSGKSALGNEIIAAEYHMGGNKKNLKWQYEDCERGNRFSTESLYGVDIFSNNVLEGVPDTVDELDARHSLFLDNLKKDDRGIYLLDSLDSLRDAERRERQEKRKKAYKDGKDFKEGTYGLSATKFLSQEFFRNQMGAVADKKSIMIIMSQVRHNMDPMSFKKWVQAGGNALVHWMTTTVWFSRLSKIKRSNMDVGFLAKAKLEKSRHPRPFRECQFVFYYDHGVDNIGSCLDYLFDLRGKDGQLTKKQHEISLKGVTKNISTYKELLEKHNLYEKAKEDKKADTGKANLSVDWLDDWFAADDARKKLKIDFFGETLSRDELIEKAENDSKFAHEIEVMTIMKWEEFEESIKTKRKGKYK